MDKFLRLYCDGLPLSCLTTRCVESVSVRDRQLFLSYPTKLRCSPVNVSPVLFFDDLRVLDTFLGDLVFLGTSGDGGDVTLLANGDITLAPDASIRSEGLLGGNITLKSDATITVLGGNITSYSLTDVPGSKGGDINVMARSLSLTGGSLLGASTLGQGNSGSVNINARDTVSFDGVGSNGLSSAALSGVGSTAVGQGGDINITSESL